MRGTSIGLRSRAMLLTYLMLMACISSISVLPAQNANEDMVDVELATLPVFQLRIGDEWVYDTLLDVMEIVDPDDPDWYGTDFPEPLTGDTTRVVENITIVEHLGSNETAYIVHTFGSYTGEGTFPAPVIGLVTGIINIDFERIEWIRLSDMAVMRQVTNLYIELDHLAGTELLTDIVYTWVLEPNMEYYDFPSNLHEEWSSSFSRNESWTGDKGHFSPSEGVNEFERAYNVTDYAEPPIVWSGCENAFNVSQTDSEGEPTEYRWICPEVRGPLVEWQDDIIFGAPVYLELKAFTSGAASSNQIETKSAESTDYTNLTLGAPMIFTVWLNDSAGDPLTNELIRVNYLNKTTNFTTDANGSVLVNISTGVKKDNTPTLYDWGSHGVLITHPASSTHKVFTVTLNSSAIAEGIALRAAGMEHIEGWIFGSFTLATQLGDQMRW